MIDMDLLFDTIKRNSIEVIFDKERAGAVQKGNSKFGGKPDLPENFKWPYCLTDSFDDTEVKNRPLLFLAQINCEEVSEYDAEGLLPERGIMYFFYEIGSQKWGFDPKDKGCAQVFYYEEAPEDFVPAEFPKDLQEDFILPEIALKFEQKASVPGSQEFFLNNIADLEWEEYEKEREKFCGSSEESITKLLGYADIIQNEMLTECELVSRNIYMGGKYPKMTAEQENQLNKAAREWVLLFQIDSVEKEDFIMMFGDCGRIYFYIKKEDLEKRNFENIWLILQCY